jgi:hypothetical protein
MAKAKEISNEMDHILNVVTGYPQGATMQQIAAATGIVEPRTLQRRLKTLAGKGSIILSGSKKGARYYPSSVNYLLPASTKEQLFEEPNSEIPLSSESQKILAILSIPWQQRPPVAYRRSFVDQYHSNESYYLSEGERARLANLTTNATGLSAGTYAKQILQRLLIDLSWNSSRLEGNTYTLLDTERLLSHGEPAPEKSAAEAQMILNHKDAIEFLVRGADETGFNRYTLLNLHAMLSNNLLPDPAAPGRLRTFGVGIKKSAYTPTAIPQLIEEMFDVILAKAGAIKDPHEQALFAMVQLPYLQPFDDVNKRVSRLAANIPLNQHNLVPISFIGVPEDLYIKGLLAVYELNRTELLKDIFIWACERSADRYAQMRQTIGEPDPFRTKYRYALQEIVTQIISQNMTQYDASIIIKADALRLPGPDSARYIEMVETELLSLHDGNFARYRISKKEFDKWKETWQK